MHRKIPGGVRVSQFAPNARACLGRTDNREKGSGFGDTPAVHPEVCQASGPATDWMLNESISSAMADDDECSLNADQTAWIQGQKCALNTTMLLVTFALACSAPCCHRTETWNVRPPAPTINGNQWKTHQMWRQNCLNRIVTYRFFNKPSCKLPTPNREGVINECKTLGSNCTVTCDGPQYLQATPKVRFSLRHNCGNLVEEPAAVVPHQQWRTEMTKTRCCGTTEATATAAECDNPRISAGEHKSFCSPLTVQTRAVCTSPRVDSSKLRLKQKTNSDPENVLTEMVEQTILDLTEKHHRRKANHQYRKPTTTTTTVLRINRFRRPNMSVLEHVLEASIQRLTPRIHILGVSLRVRYGYKCSTKTRRQKLWLMLPSVGVTLPWLTIVARSHNSCSRLNQYKGCLRHPKIAVDLKRESKRSATSYIF
ncbi:hypothetical protein CLF_107578 [Clonorchis sinensis]|uniref:Uncharacterized protein n=1 Tax=Clonorchis sinensis TaxID=79923 RepID=G7YQU4_CLOSI|nr:hypothetical protein CLF_107578 [Clonorchis sinensis]